MKDTRPVKCYICRRKMYYLGHPKFKPEFKLDIETDVVYIHRECLKILKKEMKK